MNLKKIRNDQGCPAALCLIFPASHSALSRILSALTVVRLILQLNLQMRLKSPLMSFAEIKQPNRLLYSFKVIYLPFGKSEQLDLNQRHTVYKTVALPTELCSNSRRSGMFQESSFAFMSQYHNITKVGRFCTHFLFHQENDKTIFVLRKIIVFCPQ